MEGLKVLVIGAGAIGTFVGGSLALAGNRVIFLEQPQAVEELRRHGLHLDLTVGRKLVVDIQDASVTFVTNTEEAVKLGPFDFAIFALKSYDTAAALNAMGPFTSQLPPVLCLSNGVDNEPALAAVLGQENVIAGIVTSSVSRLGVGSIVLERSRGMAVAGGHPLSLFLQEALKAAGLKVMIIPGASDMKWSKMLTNLPANATAAILDMTAAEVFSHPALFRLEMQMLREALAVMASLRIHVVDLPGVPVRALALGAKIPAFLARPIMKKSIGAGRGGKMPSFHIDLFSGRGKSEVDWLNGAVVRYGRKMGVKAPVNEVLTKTLLSLTNGELPVGAFSHQPEKLLSLI